MCIAQSGWQYKSSTMRLKDANIYIRQVNGVKLADILFSDVCVCVCPSVCTHIWMQISRKRFEIETWYQLTTNRKWPMADQMMTSSMTSRDLQSSRS